MENKYILTLKEKVEELANKVPIEIFTKNYMEKEWDYSINKDKKTITFEKDKKKIELNTIEYIVLNYVASYGLNLSDEIKSTKTFILTPGKNFEETSINKINELLGDYITIEEEKKYRI